MSDDVKIAEQVTCYVCGSHDYSLPEAGVRDNPHLKVLKCGSCGLIFLSEMEHIKDGFYEDSQMHVALGGELDPESWLKEVEPDDERRFHYLKDRMQEKTVLDFGCGCAGFLIRAKNVCANVYGIEVERRLYPHFLSSGLEVHPDIETLQLNISEGMKFDFITMFHVMEHLPDPRKMLEDLAPLLKEDGEIIIEVPHADDALITLYHNEAFAHFTYWSCHLYVFTVGALKQLGEQAGLQENETHQVQRFPLSNHLYWLVNGKPGGHQEWDFLNDDILNEAYAKKLADLKCCDTLIMSFKKGTKTS